MKGKEQAHRAGCFGISKIKVAFVTAVTLVVHMPKRNSPTLNVTIDADIKAELVRRKRDEALNISSFVNRILRLHLIFGKNKTAAK